MNVQENIRLRKYQPKAKYVSYSRDPVANGAYNQEKYEGVERFKQDLFEEFGVGSNPKAQQCFEIAWEGEHAYGFEGIYDYFSELVALIK